MKTVNAIARCARVFALVLLQSTTHGQTVSRCVDSNGHVTYTDDACSAASSRRQVQAAPQRTAAAQAPTERALYDLAVAEVERQYPALNPDSPAHDGALEEQVLKRMQFYVQKSYRQDYALRAAVTDVMVPRPPPEVAVQVAPDPSRQEKAQHALVEATKAALPRSLLLGSLWGLLALSLVFFLRWSWRRSRAAATRATFIVGNTSAKDIARAAGGATATVQRKTAGVMAAFREGRREAERRGD